MNDKVVLGDCLEVMKDLPDDCVDAIVTDPPYGLEFMGKDWDKFGENANFLRAPGTEGSNNTYGPRFGVRQHANTKGVEKVLHRSTAFQEFCFAWATECLRVAKPGAYLLAFGGTRMYHRLAVAIEDAGWELRDCFSYLYGSGFPKSLDVSKAIDRQLGAPRDVSGKGDAVDRNALDYGGATGKAKNGLKAEYAASDPNTNAAKQWAGWGTALKPAWEPIILARKPLISTVAANVLKHGTGGINIDGCRIGFASEADKASAVPGSMPKGSESIGTFKTRDRSAENPADLQSAKGRWPANVILGCCGNDPHDPDCAVRLLDEQTGKVGGGDKRGRGKANDSGFYAPGEGADRDSSHAGPVYADKGGASRFFLTVKTDQTCTLCALPLPQKQVTPKAWQSTLAETAGSPLRDTQAEHLDSVPASAELSPLEKLVQAAKSAADLCDSCAIGIARSIAAMQQGHSPEPPRGWVSIDAHNERILLRCLASFAALLGNTDTTPTMEHLSLFFGYVRDAMRNSTQTSATESASGQTSRLFYSAKASRSERTHGGTVENKHPTVKPISLMRYHVRLVTPPGGSVLDPFCGSGSGLVAADLEGFDYLGIEQDPESHKTACERLANVEVLRKKTDPKTPQAAAEEEG